MKNALILQHAPFEGPGALLPFLQRQGYACQICHVYLESALPPAHWDLVAVLGGPMNVDEEVRLPWLAPEKAFLRQCVDSGVPLLGICLGGQLIARVLGARVVRNAHKEIGWFDITRAPGAEKHPLGRHWPERLELFHWHGDTFELPEGAVRLASSAACQNQAFAWGGRVLALQFHCEFTGENAEGLACGDDSEDWQPGPYIQLPEHFAANPERFHALNRTMDMLIKPWLEGLS
ncbi:MAG: type 1 glutamine amidotransferase [Candidatus Methylacidiphilales bacterium]|nr:type 1 glutamine amidotransferase [Candidatus Methylacidiphilales bacterium]